MYLSQRLYSFDTLQRGQTAKWGPDGCDSCFLMLFVLLHLDSTLFLTFFLCYSFLFLSISYKQSLSPSFSSGIFIHLFV